MIILRLCMFIVALLCIVCLIGAQAGDNVDARATAGLLYIPAMFFAFLEVILIFIWWAFG